MKTGFFAPLLLCLALLTPLTLTAGKRPYTSVEDLKIEIARMLKGKDLSFMNRSIEHVTIDFLINARNELVILDVFGDCAKSCDHVKDALNYRTVNYKQDKQLIRYTLDIRLEKRVG